MTAQGQPASRITDEKRAELREKARANVATFPPLTGEQLAELRRIFGGPTTTSKSA